jgi:hypothetical protein
MITGFSLLRRAVSGSSLFSRNILASLLLLFMVSLTGTYLAAQESSPTAPPARQRAEQPIAPKGKTGRVKPKPGAEPDNSRTDNTFYDWLKFSAWIVIVGAAGCCIGFITGRATASRSRGDKNSDLPSQISSDPSPQILRDLSPQIPVDTPGAKEAFQFHHSELSDLYEPLWRAAEDKNQDDQARSSALAAWRERLNELEPSAKGPLIQALNEMEGRTRDKTVREKAEIWLTTLGRWGLDRYQPDHIDIDKDSLRRFYVWPERNSGRAVVVAPCWLYRGLVIRKGHASTQSVADA